MKPSTQKIRLGLRARLRRTYASLLSPDDRSITYWASQAKASLQDVQGDLDVRSRYGVRLVLRIPDDLPYYEVIAGGTYEYGTTHLLRAIARRNDVFVDLGANVGWYTLHFAKLAGKARCFAFEPMTGVAERLRRNVSINGMTGRIEVIGKAVGDGGDKQTLTLYTFAGLPHLHASLSALGRRDVIEQQVEVTSLDRAIGDGSVAPPDIIKADIEGAEMQMLNGAEKLLRSKSPVWILEMNQETSAAFGFKPGDLLERLLTYAPYRFIRIPRARGLPVKMSSTADFENGDNVVAYAEGRDAGRFADILKRL